MKIDMTNIKPYQARVDEWARECFPEGATSDVQERSHRFLEESLELFQAAGMDREDAHTLVDYVFDRPAGDAAQEAGGAALTLAALCTALRLDSAASADAELTRVWKKIDAIREKQANRPSDSPLPQ